MEIWCGSLQLFLKCFFEHAGFNRGSILGRGYVLTDSAKMILVVSERVVRYLSLDSNVLFMLLIWLSLKTRYSTNWYMLMILSKYEIYFNDIFLLEMNESSQIWIQSGKHRRVHVWPVVHCRTQFWHTEVTFAHHRSVHNSKSTWHSRLVTDFPDSSCFSSLLWWSCLELLLSIDVENEPLLSAELAESTCLINWTTVKSLI